LPSRLLPGMRVRSWTNLLTAPLLTITAFIVVPHMICVAPGHKLIALSFLAPLSAVWPNILGGPLEEEFGWRGYLLPRLAGWIGNLWATIAVRYHLGELASPVDRMQSLGGTILLVLFTARRGFGCLCLARLLRDWAQHPRPHHSALRFQHLLDHAGCCF
jgi:hypothetical protein